MKKLCFLLLLAFSMQLYGQNHINATGYHYKGFINGKIPITMDLRIDKKHNVRGFYYYDRIGQKIYLEGKMDKNNFIKLTETTNFDTTGYFEGIKKDSVFQGTWYNASKTKAFKFKLTENYKHSAKVVYYYVFERILMYDTSNVAYYDVEIDLCYPVRTPYPATLDTITRLLTKIYFTYTDQSTIDESIKTYFKEERKSFRSEKDFSSYEEIKRHNYKWHDYLAGVPVFNQNDFLIIDMATEAYQGGVHYIYSDYFHIIDLQTGQKWKLNDVVKNDKIQELTQLIRDKLKKSNYKNEIFNYSEVEVPDNFYFTSQKITFYYNVYDIACYATGPIEVTFDYSEIKDLLSDKFKARMLRQ